LIDALGTQIWEIDQQEASLQVFKGGYSRYREEQKQAGDSDSLAEDSRDPEQIAYQKRRAAKNRAKAKKRRRKARIQEIEARVAELETRAAEISRILADPPDDTEKVQLLGDDYVEIQNELHALIAEWEQLHT
jgi:ATPase subunit of ABC transporter with duplicated ATPase domains